MKKINVHLNTKDIALISVLTGIMLIFVFVPINIGAVSMAFMALIPVIVAAQVKGLKLGVIMSVIFGVSSLIVAFTMPRTPLDPLFQNPMVSVFPRIFIGIAVYFSCKFTRYLTEKMKIKDKRLRDTIAFTASSIAGTVTNTVLVLSMLLAFNYGKEFSGWVINWVLIGAILSTNFVIELILTAVICPPISLAVNAFYKREPSRSA